MRIAVITRSLPTPGSGGMEKVTMDLVRSWRSNGCDVTVITAERSAVAHGSAGGDVVVVPGNARRLTARWSRDVAAAVDWSRFDVILGVSSTARMVARLPARPPVVMQAHGTSFDEIVTKLRVLSVRSLATLGRNVLWAVRDVRDARHYDAIATVGPGIASTLRRYPRRQRPRRIEIIPNGVPTPPPPSTREPRRYDLVYVGRLHREKGVDLLVRAVRATTMSVAIVGDGPQEGRLRKLAAGASNVQFLGRLGEDDVAAVRRSARVAIMPSRRREGLPLAALESLAAGRPVLASAGVVQAFASDVPDGIERISTRVRRMRADITRITPARAVSLPSLYEAARASDAYLRLFSSLQASPGEGRP